MVCVINAQSKIDQSMRSPMQTTARKLVKKYSTIYKQKKQISLLRSAPPNKSSSDLQTVLQAILYIRDLQKTLQG